MASCEVHLAVSRYQKLGEYLPATSHTAPAAPPSSAHRTHGTHAAHTTVHAAAHATTHAEHTGVHSLQRFRKLCEYLYLLLGRVPVQRVVKMLSES